MYPQKTLTQSSVAMNRFGILPPIGNIAVGTGITPNRALMTTIPPAAATTAMIKPATRNPENGPAREMKISWFGLRETLALLYPHFTCSGTVSPPPQYRIIFEGNPYRRIARA